jgi:hypothetical protein
MDRNCHVLADSCRAILPFLLLGDGLISQLFHNTQPIATFAQLVSVLFRHFPVPLSYTVRECCQFKKFQGSFDFIFY